MKHVQAQLRTAKSLCLFLISTLKLEKKILDHQFIPTISI